MEHLAAGTARRTAGSRAPARPEGDGRDLLYSADRHPVAGSAGALRSLHHLLQPLQPLEQEWGLGGDSGAPSKPWELLSRAEHTGAALLVRVSRGAQRRVALASGGDAELREHVPGTVPVGGRKIEVSGRGGPNRRRGRTAKLTLRCAPVDLLPPKDRESEPPIRLIAASALEEDPPRHPALPASKPGKPKKQPPHWMLLTTEGQADLDTALTVLGPVRTALADRPALPCAEGRHPHRGPPPRRGR